MGALPNVKPEPKRKPVARETAKLDRYGRDPKSLPEQLRARKDAWAPVPIAAQADLHRLASGAVYYAFILTVNLLSLGRPRGPKAPWHEWTEPISALDLAELCHANVRDIQRQLSELESRKLIAVKSLKQGGSTKYSISLLYSKWQGLEDYAVWKRRQVVRIDEAQDSGETEDEQAPPISKEAVAVTKGRETVRPGRATRPRKISVGVNSYQFVSEDSRELTHSTVIQGGRLIVSVASFQSTPHIQSEPQKDHSTLTSKTPPVAPKPAKAPAVVHPRSAELIAIFDPILADSAARLLSGDLKSLHDACVAIADCEHEYLVQFATRRRESSPVKSPLHIKMICAEAVASWRASKVLDGAGIPNETAELIRELEAKERERRYGKKQ